MAMPSWVATSWAMATRSGGNGPAVSQTLTEPTSSLPTTMGTTTYRLSPAASRAWASALVGNVRMSMVCGSPRRSPSRSPAIVIE